MEQQYWQGADEFEERKSAVMAQPQEIGALAAFLCSDAARHLTGSTIDVNGASYVR